MDSENPQLVEAEQEILSILQQHSSPYPPVELIRDLRQRRIPEALARAAIWYLIDRYEIELTWDRRLRRVSPEAAFTV
jgi:hypothetical protein